MQQIQEKSHSSKSPRDRFEPSGSSSPKASITAVTGSLKRGSWMKVRSKKEKNSSPRGLKSHSQDDTDLLDNNGSLSEESPEPGLRRWTTRRQTISETEGPFASSTESLT